VHFDDPRDMNIPFSGS